MERIPNLSRLRANKPGYDTRYQIDTTHPLFNDPLVDPREPEFGFDDASSYYSKPNPMTEQVLPGVPDAPLVRLDIAKRLKQANDFLLSDVEVRETLGSPAQIKIDDALRPAEVQRFAYEFAWPKIIRQANPNLSEEEVVELLPKYVAKPKLDTPTPHLTGGSVDVKLINAETGEAFDRGHDRGSIAGTALPDFYEDYQANWDESDIENLAPEDTNKIVLLGRRVLYFAMVKVGGLYVNPDEIWHYGKGDPLSEYVSGSGHPYYGIASLPQWYKDEMKELKNKKATDF